MHGGGPVPVQGGADTPQGMADWYGCVDVLCAATYAEGFGLPMVEAMACGVPVITTKCSSMEEMNPDGISGGRGAVLQRRPQGVVDKAVGRGDVPGVRAILEERGEVDPEKLRESVSQYDVEAVAENHMRPTVDVLLEKMAARKAAAA